MESLSHPCGIFSCSTNCVTNGLPLPSEIHGISIIIQILVWFIPIRRAGMVKFCGPVFQSFPPLTLRLEWNTCNLIRLSFEVYYPNICIQRHASLYFWDGNTYPSIKKNLSPSPSTVESEQIQKVQKLEKL